MLRYFFVFSLLISSLLCSLSLFAVEVPDLYSAKIPVKSQNSADRSVALKAAMQAVLIKVGGHADVVKAPTIKAALRNYKTFYTTYRYNREDQQNHLIVSFDEKKINQLFIEANLPLWGSLRPQILVWLVEEQQFDRQVLASSDSSALPQQIKDFSSLRGLPMIMPLMDLTDATQVNITDLWGRFLAPVERVSSRYAPDMVAIIRLSDNSLVDVVEQSVDSQDGSANQQSENVQQNLCQPNCPEQATKKRVALDWQLVLDGKVLTPKFDLSAPEQQVPSAMEQADSADEPTNGQSLLPLTNTEQVAIEDKFVLSRVAGEFSNQFQDINYQGDDYQSLLALALEDITKVVYQRYALSSDLAQDYIIDVSNVDSLATYKAVSEFLGQLSSVRSVSLHQVKGTHKRFALELIGSEAAFLASLKLHKGLTQYVDPYAAKALDDVPVFIWNAK